LLILFEPIERTLRASSATPAHTGRLADVDLTEAAASGDVTVTNGPFAETKEILGGYALLNAASKEEAVEYTRRFLEHIGEETPEGTWETYQLFEMPAGEGQ